MAGGDCVVTAGEQWTAACGTDGTPQLLDCAGRSSALLLEHLPTAAHPE
jgi:hypothetical protein